MLPNVRTRLTEAVNDMKQFLVVFFKNENDVLLDFPIFSQLYTLFS